MTTARVCLLLRTVGLDIDGRSVALTKQQARLLGAIAVHDGMISVDRLMSALWPAGAPPSAANAIQVTISKIRSKAVELGWTSGLIVNRSARYGLAPNVVRDVDEVIGLLGR